MEETKNAQIISFLVKFHKSLDEVKTPICTTHGKYFVVGLDTLYAFETKFAFKINDKYASPTITTKKETLSEYVANNLFAGNIVITLNDDPSLVNLRAINHFFRQLKEKSVATIYMKDDNCTIITGFGTLTFIFLEKSNESRVISEDCRVALCTCFKIMSKFNQL